MLRALCIILLAAAFRAASAQKPSVGLIHTAGAKEKASGYGFAYGGPQNLPNRVVTALHRVSGKSDILAVWNGQQSKAAVEKIYKASPGPAAACRWRRQEKRRASQAQEA